MTTIETVSIEDVYPLEDEYGNQFLSRDYTANANKAYVKELARSMAAKGVPDEPVVLVRDGGIYRIKAGNSRVMAMRELGTTRFEAVIDEDDTPQSLIEAAIRTNTKKKYEAVEESRFVQQLAMLAPDEYVGDMAGIEPADVARIRHARAIVDDAAEDMSLLRLIAIGEFEGDPEAVEELTNCTEKEFEHIADRLRKDRAKAEREREMRSSLEERGVGIVDEMPHAMRHVLSVSGADAIPKDLPEGCVATYDDWCASYCIYAPAADASPEEEADRARVAEINGLYKAAEEHRDGWIAEHVNDGLPALCELNGAADSPYWMGVNNFIETHGIELDDAPARAVNSYLGNRKSILPLWAKSCDEITDDRCNAFIELTDAMRACGYEPCEEEQVLYDLAHDQLSAKGGE